MKELLLNLSLERPKWVIAFTVLITLLFGSQFPRVKIDTDPENMLSPTEPVRVLHSEIKETFGLHDFLVLGVHSEDGVFRPEILQRVQLVTDLVLGMEEVIGDDLLAPSEVDDISQLASGGIRVGPLMETPPQSLAASDHIRERIKENPMLRGKLASDDGKALALFIPLRTKDDASTVGDAITELVAGFAKTEGEQYHLAGLPVAEDSFGTQMFIQMGIAAPIAFLAIFFLMLVFFRKPRIVAAPMVVAMMSVLWTMGLLIGSGFTLHIMSSMIPVFLIPIAVLDSIHLLSEIYHHYGETEDMPLSIRKSVDDLYTPMAFTSITTIVGFASLMMTPIPPVQVFGGFVAFGVFVAWLLTLLVVPAFAVLVPPSALGDFGKSSGADGILGRQLGALRRFSERGRTPVVLGTVVLLLVSAWGVTKISVNDNPVFWFKPNHPLRVADKVMNEHLAGTYLAYLSIEAEEEGALLEPEWMQYIESLGNHLADNPQVGGVTSIADVLEKVDIELQPGKSAGEIPSGREAIAQYLFLYEMSGGDPEDLFKLITPENDRAVLWIQMPEGENKKVQQVIASAEEWLATHPTPTPAETGWGGLAYINVVWQEKMVAGMGKALGGSFLIVLMMMSFLFRSLILGLISMVPLSLTIGLTYGYIGFSGRDYDMPTAVLSSLALGLSIDFSIHFIQRYRHFMNETNGDRTRSLELLFGAPAQALARNIAVIAIGFVPMFFSNLMPYVTVGKFFVAIMLISGLATFVILPALLGLVSTRHLLRGRSLGAVAAGIFLVGSLAAGTVQTALAQSGAVDAAGQKSLAGQLSATDLMKAAHLNYFYAADDGRAHVSMEIVDRRGKTRIRELVLLRIDLEEGGEQRYFAYFLKPSDVKRTAFLAWKDPAEQDARWIYIPALDLTKPISSNDKKSSFVGSDFSYEDVSGRHWTEDNHTWVKDEILSVEGQDVNCAIIESHPKESDYFVRKVTWVDRERLLPVREEFYGKKPDPFRIFEALEVEMVGGHQTVTVRKMTRPGKSNSTVVRMTEIEYDLGMDESVFTERSLQSPPRKFIR